MAKPSQYQLTHRELLELLVKDAGVKEGRWMLVANFGIAPGNFGPSPGESAPGVAFALQKVGIQKAEQNTPDELTVDASKIEVSS